nr:kelch-like protein 26 isoform X1 [Kogia breviceps]
MQPAVSWARVQSSCFLLELWGCRQTVQHVPESMADKNGALKCTFSAPGHSTSLLQGLAALRAQGQLLDVVLTINRETFHAHKVVLAACSDYFSRTSPAASSPWSPPFEPAGPQHRTPLGEARQGSS